MRFESPSQTSSLEYRERLTQKSTPLKFGVDFLDESLRGIFPDDIVLLGAPSGMGKTQLCCNIALANLLDGKKVHYIALEASKYEIERRLKFPLVFEAWRADPSRPTLPARMTFSNWLAGDFNKLLMQYEAVAHEYFEKAFRDIFVFYKGERFGVEELIDTVYSCSDQTDLILLDHVNYMDFDDSENENRAIKRIAMTARTLALEQRKPILLVAHLRKRDRSNEDLVAGMEEFHGSSDLFKIATKVITMSPGRMSLEGWFETFFRVPKNRNDGSPTRFIAREFFNPKKGTYEKCKYRLGWADQKRSSGFAEIEPTERPDWFGGGSGIPYGAEVPRVAQPQPTRTPTLQRMPYSDQGD